MFFPGATLALALFGNFVAASPAATELKAKHEIRSLEKRHGYQASEYVKCWSHVSESFATCNHDVSSGPEADYQVALKAISKLQVEVNTAINKYQECSDCNAHGAEFKLQYSQSIKTCITQFQEIVQSCKTRYSASYDQFFAGVIIKFQPFFTYSQNQCHYFGVDPKALFAGINVNLLHGAGLQIGAGIQLGGGGGFNIGGSGRYNIGGHGGINSGSNLGDSDTYGAGGRGDGGVQVGVKIGVTQYLEGWKNIASVFLSTSGSLHSLSGVDYTSAVNHLEDLQVKVNAAIAQFKDCYDCQARGAQYQIQYRQVVSLCLTRFQDILQFCTARYPTYWKQYFYGVIVKFQGFFNYIQDSCQYFGISASFLFANVNVNLLGFAGIHLNAGLGLGVGVGGRGGVLLGAGAGFDAGAGVGVSLH